MRQIWRMSALDEKPRFFKGKTPGFSANANTILKGRGKMFYVLKTNWLSVSQSATWQESFSLSVSHPATKLFKIKIRQMIKMVESCFIFLNSVCLSVGLSVCQSPVGECYKSVSLSVSVCCPSISPGFKVPDRFR